MPDEPSPGELQRWITGMQRDMANRFDKLDQRMDRRFDKQDQRLDSLVSTEMLDLVTKRWEDQLRDMRDDLTDLKQARKEDHATARAAKQWAIGMGVAVLGVAVAIFSIVVGKV